MLNNKRNIIVRAAAIVLALAGCSGGAMSRFKKCVNQNDIAGAYIIYREELIKNGEQATKANYFLNARIDDLLGKYYAGKLDYVNSCGVIEDICMFEGASAKAVKAMQEINDCEASKKNFEYGKEAYAKGNYYEALNYLGQTIEKDPNYAEI